MIKLKTTRNRKNPLIGSVMLGQIVLFLAFGVAIIHTQKAEARISPNYNGIPTDVIQAIENTDPCQAGIPPKDVNYAQWQWISDDNDSNTTSVTKNVPFGTTQVQLRYNTLSAICNNALDGNGNILSGAKDKKTTRTTVPSNTTALSATNGASINASIKGKFVDISYNGCIYFFGTRFCKQPSRDFNLPDVPEHIPFTLNLPVGLTEGPHDFEITIPGKTIHEYNSGVFACVVPNNLLSPGFDITMNSLSDPRCIEVPTKRKFTINVLPQPNDPPVGNIDPAIDNAAGKCELDGWTLDPNETSKSISYRLEIDGQTVYEGSADKPRSDVSPTVNHGIAIYSLRSKFRTGTHSAKLFARDTKTNDESQVSLSGWQPSGVATFTTDCIPKYDLWPDAQCYVDEGRLHFQVDNRGDRASPPDVKIQYSSTINGTKTTYPDAKWSFTPVGTPNAHWKDDRGVTVPAGQNVILNIIVTPAEGTDTIITGSRPSNSGNLACSSQPKANLPYTQVWRSDIWSGAQFGEANSKDPKKTDPIPAIGCGPADVDGKRGDINLWGRKVGNELHGSFDEYGIFSNGSIANSGATINFFSQSNAKGWSQPQTDTGGTGYTFANDGTTGNLNETHCIKDYFGWLSQGSVNDVTTSSIDLSPTPAPDQAFIKASGPGPLHLTNSDTAHHRINGKHVILVENRDVVIDDDQFLAPDNDLGILIRGGVGDTTDDLVDKLPALFVVVKGGNIYFKNSVHRADGTWIAQPAYNLSAPDPVTGAVTKLSVKAGTGEVDTCVNDAGVPFGINDADFYTKCGGDADPTKGEDDANSVQRRHITIKGAVIAQKLRLRRLSGDAVNYAGSDSRNNSKAAERIKVSPEIYFAYPVTGFSTRGDKYDSFEELPPVF